MKTIYRPTDAWNDDVFYAGWVFRDLTEQEYEALVAYRTIHDGEDAKRMAKRLYQKIELKPKESKNASNES